MRRSTRTRARAFSANAAAVFDLDIGESVKANVVLTCVELSGLLIIIGIGVWALGGGGDFSRITEFDTGDKSVLTGVIAATGLAFFATVGSEDSVIMAEECQKPRRILPKVLLLGLGITGLIYVLVSISAIAPVPAAQLSEGRDPVAAGGGGRGSGVPARAVRGHHHVRRRQHHADRHAHGEPCEWWGTGGSLPACHPRGQHGWWRASS